MPLAADARPVRRGLLRDEIYARLRDAIVQGELAPAEVLRDADLADRLGVSRTPVREAILRLSESGLVTSVPGRSTVVAEVDVAVVRDAQAVVAAMHRLAVLGAVGRLAGADLERMSRANGRFEAALAAGDVDAALAADDELHDVLVRACGNQAVVAVLEQFTPVVRRLERLRFGTHAGHDSVALHTALVERCRARDAEGAAAVSDEIWQTLQDLIPHDAASAPGAAQDPRTTGPGTTGLATTATTTQPTRTP